MVLQVLAHAGQVGDRADAERTEFGALPTPDSWSSCGVLMAPPHRISSADRTRLVLPSCLNSTPTASVPSKMILVAYARVATVRFGRPITGCR